MELVIRVRPENYGAAMRQVDQASQNVIPGMRDIKRLAGGLFAGFTTAGVVSKLEQVATAVVETGADKGL